MNLELVEKMTNLLETRRARYKEIAEELGRSNPALKDPSISLMEFCIANRNKIKTYVFVRKDIYNERNTYMNNKGNEYFKPAFVKDVRVFEIISYITNLQKGNWFRQFEDLQDLEEIIKIEFGK